MITFSFITAIGIFIVLWKVGVFRLFKVKEIRRVTDGGMDLLLTVGLITILAGTVSGAIIAMTSGLILSAMLLIVRFFTKSTYSIGGKLNGIHNRIRKVSILRRKSSDNSVS